MRLLHIYCMFISSYFGVLSFVPQNTYIGTRLFSMNAHDNAGALNNMDFLDSQTLSYKHGETFMQWMHVHLSNLTLSHET